MRNIIFNYIIMKRINTILVVILLVVLAGCGGNKQSNDDLIIVDVSKSYPKKELILQDFMDVEYIVLETTDEILNQGVVMTVGNEIMIVKNNVNDGDLFIYDRTGKGIRKFNRKGQGGEEYSSLSEVVLDEERNEIFVNSSYNKILVYDLFGNFKRSLPRKENSRYSGLYEFDRESLICTDTSYDTDEEEPDKPPFLIISKQDGKIIKEILIPCQQKRQTQYKNPNRDDITYFTSNLPNGSIIPYHDNWILTTYSSDTIFRYLPDHSLTPFMLQTPSIQSYNAKAFLALKILTERYYFLYTEKMEPEFLSVTLMEFHRTNLMYDRHERNIYEYTIYNDDYQNKRIVAMPERTRNHEIAFWQKIEAYQLVEALEKSQLKDGKLKDIAAKLDAEDNPVIMLVKQKK